MTVFQYTQFQEYLLAWLGEQKNLGRKLSFEIIARQLGLRSKGHAYRIFHDESMPLTTRTMVRLLELLQLPAVEQEYFEAMVAFNRATSMEERRTYLERMGKIAGHSTANRISPDACAYFSEWYFPVLREAICMPWFRGDFRKLARQFSPVITEAQARRGAQILHDLKLVRLVANGAYQPCEAYVHAGADIQPVLVSTFQKKMMALASDALDREVAKDREISTLTFSFPAEKFQAIKKALRKLQDELAQEILKEKAAGDVVYQFNMQCFPVYRTGSES